MLPSSATSNSFYRMFSYPILSSQPLEGIGKRIVRAATRVSRNVGAKYFLNLFLRKLCGPLPFTAGDSAFCLHVSVIVERCSKKEMIGSNTGRVVATVKYPHTFGYRPEMNLPRSTMRTNPDCPDPNPFSISVLVDRPIPNPTAISLIYSAPKSFCHGINVPEAGEPQ